VTEKQIVFTIAAAILTALLGVLLYSLAMQKKAMGTQGSAVSKVDESLVLQRESIDLQRQGLRLAEESAALQRETLELLRALLKARS
jgi:hypothetical protein